MGQNTAASQLETLLAESPRAMIERERLTFDQLAAPFEKSLVLFGAGGLGKKTLRGLRLLGIEPLGFADNNPDLWGTEIGGVKVLSLPDAVKKFGQTAAFVVTIWKGEATDTMADRCGQLSILGCPRVIPFGFLYWKYPEVFLPHYAFDLPHKVCEQADAVRRAFSLWSDDASRNEYIAQLRWRLLLDFDALPPPVAHEIYFPDDLLASFDHEVFVDCGAYDGDTIRSLLDSRHAAVEKVIAFEPDPRNLQKLEEYAAVLPGGLRDKVAIHGQAVGATRSSVRFDASGTEASAVGSGDFEVQSVPLDEILAQEAPTYIKMDIEGSEMDALAGAQQTIKRCLPVLAVCSYHRQDHVWRIPLFIHSLSRDYRFFLRPHLLEVWDLVCYAVPKDRLRRGIAHG